MEQEDLSIEVINEIKEIRNAILRGDISLLDYELSPLFLKLKKSLNVNNLVYYSRPFQEGCELLSDKFQELKDLLNSLNNESILSEYLKNDPSDEELSSILTKSWKSTFYLDPISFKFLNYSNERYSKENRISGRIEHFEIKKSKGKFLLEISGRKFTEEMELYYKKIVKILPCSFNELFGNEKDQIRIYEYFVYLLHLIQLGFIKYNKNEDVVYK